MTLTKAGVIVGPDQSDLAWVNSVFIFCVDYGPPCQKSFLVVFIVFYRFLKEKGYCDFLICFPGQRDLSKIRSAPEGGDLFQWSKFFPLGFDPNDERRNPAVRDVVLLSLQRDDFASTSIRLLFSFDQYKDVGYIILMVPLESRWYGVS